MPLTVEQFTQRLTSSGVMSEDELRDWIAAVPVEKRSTDGDQLARELVREKRLTKFQAEQLYAGKGSSLTLGNYVILDKLGQGGMGMVLKARHRRMGRVVALKVMSPAAVKSPDAVKRFHREVQTAAKLTHPNIVTAFDADEAKGTHFLVMEYVEGDDLSQLVKKHGTLSVEQTIECLIQAARGLTHAHAEGVIHRDIKPANLLLDKHGIVKILDMGLARLESGLSDAAGVAGAGLTQSGTIMGTVDYMSPEQAEDTRHADARTDIYALGCSLYYLLTGHAVYGGETMMKKLLAHRDAPLPSLVADAASIRADASSVGHALNSIFHKMIAKRLADRYQSMTEVIADLERCRAGQSVTVNVDAVSGESGSSNELQNFLRQISGEEGSQVTNATSSSPFGAAVDRTAETVFTTNNSAGTDPHTVMTLASGQKLRSRNMLLASVGVVLLLLGAWWVFRTPTGTVHIEITDDQIEVTLGETGRTLRGKVDESIKLPIGEHVLHLQIGETTLDTPEITVAKSESVELKFERVGNRVRVMRNKEFLVAKELPRSKSVVATTGSSTAATYALKFDGQCVVEIPSLTWNGTDSVTMEFVVSVDADEAAVAGTTVLASWPSPKPEDELLVYRISNLWAFDARHSTKRWISSLHAVRPNERMLLTCLWDGKQTLIKVDADPGNVFEDTTTPGVGRPGLWIGGSDAHANANQLFRGTIEQVRISKGVRTALPGVPKGKLPKDKATFALYHFDEGQGDVLKDSSGNNHHGKIVGAKWVKANRESEISNFKSGISNPPSPADILTSPDYEWSAPENLGPGVNNTSYDHQLTVSADGLILVLASRRSGVQDLFECRRKSVEEPFGAAVAIKELNTPTSEGAPFLSADGLTLLYHSQQGPNHQGSSDLYQTRRRDRNSPWEKPINLGSRVNTAASEEEPCLSSDGLTLLFSSVRPGGKGAYDVWRSRRKSVDVPFEIPENLGSGVNSGLSEVAPKFAADNQTILFVRGGSQVQLAPFVAVLDTDGKLTARPLNLPMTGHVQSPTLSPDGRTLYFTAADFPGGLGGYDGWQIRRVLTPAAIARAAAANKFTNSLGMEFVRVPKGKSWLGGGGGKPGTQEVTIPDDFYLGKYEVTQEEWQKVMGIKGSNFARNGSGKEKVKDISDADLKRFPMDNQTWERCQQFVARLNEKTQESGWVYRLPTEAEWEYACRGGPLSDEAESAFDFYLQQPTNQLPSGQGNLKDTYLGRTCKVGSFPPNRLGLHDLHGNLSEWCQDIVFDDKDTSQHVCRGGHWFSSSTQCRAAFRELNAPLHQGSNIGLRLARVPVAAKSSPFVSLLNGKDLTGWRQFDPKDAGRRRSLLKKANRYCG